MRPILNACSFLAGRLEEEAARPEMHQDPARCTARALSSSYKTWPTMDSVTPLKQTMPPVWEGEKEA